MGFFGKLLHRVPTVKPAPTADAAECIHGALVPRWDKLADMGQEDKATSYRCDSCGKEFTPQAVDGLRANVIERLLGPTESAPPPLQSGQQLGPEQVDRPRGLSQPPWLN
ncbi:MAG TPA: hypothetical protein VK821_09425 [Dehalococcoidia bacterium]|nr:hypothetical protein [Dehalococcoidia bacterium]